MGTLKFEGEWTDLEKSDVLKMSGISEFENFVLSKKDSLVTLVSSAGLKLSFDFDQNKTDYHRKSRKSQEPIIKALGFSHGIRQVVDLSMGLAIDSVFFAQAGFQVTSVERNPLLHYLAKSAQMNSLRPEVKSIDFVCSDAKTFIKLHQFKVPMSAYFDPMYPHKKKSALPRQEMVLFRSLVGSDEDAAETLKTALEHNFQRVVVKRPLRAEPLASKVSYSLESKLVRFDVYVRLENK
jgi:16S rRNA (guanine1516-N2)-methyltransferase